MNQLANVGLFLGGSVITGLVVAKIARSTNRTCFTCPISHKTFSIPKDTLDTGLHPHTWPQK